MGVRNRDATGIESSRGRQPGKQPENETAMEAPRREGMEWPKPLCFHRRGNKRPNHLLTRHCSRASILVKYRCTTHLPQNSEAQNNATSFSFTILWADRAQLYHSFGPCGDGWGGTQLEPPRRSEMTAGSDCWLGDWLGHGMPPLPSTWLLPVVWAPQSMVANFQEPGRGSCQFLQGLGLRSPGMPLRLHSIGRSHSVCLLATAQVARPSPDSW